MSTYSEFNYKSRRRRRKEMRREFTHSVVKACTIGLSFGVMFGLISILSVDALEFEVTGKCESCVLLDIFRPSLGND